MENNYRKIKSYVLRAGRMSTGQQQAYDTLGKIYKIPFQDALLSQEEINQGKAKAFIEIGFGMGDATHKIAAENRDSSYIGIEVHRPGVGKLLSHIDEQKLENLRIVEHDAVEVLEKMIPDESIDGFHIFFPDPWHKKRHHKRRLIQQPFIELLAKKLKQGAYVYAVTDWEEYAQQILEVFNSVDSIENAYNGYATPQNWRPFTKFERKGKEKSHIINELMFKKK